MVQGLESWGLPVVSIVFPFWGYLIGSLLYIWLNQKKETTMETIGRVQIQGALNPEPYKPQFRVYLNPKSPTFPVFVTMISLNNINSLKGRFCYGPGRAWGQCSCYDNRSL